MKKTHVPPSNLAVEELESRVAPDVNPLFPLPGASSVISNIAQVREQAFLQPAAVQALQAAAHP